MALASVDSELLFPFRLLEIEYTFLIQNLYQINVNLSLLFFVKYIVDIDTNFAMPFS